MTLVSNDFGKRWQIIEWTKSSITYTCLVLFVICAETYAMFMPGLVSDAFSKFVHVVMSFVILTMWFAMSKTNHTTRKGYKPTHTFFHFLHYNGWS